MRLVITCLGGVILGFVLIVLFRRPPQLRSPITDNTTFQFLTQIDNKGNKKIVYGFLPYWNIAKVTPQPELTHLAYFSLTIGRDGSMLTQQDGGVDPGFSRLGSEAMLNLMELQQQRGGKTEIVLSQFNNDDIAGFLTSNTAQEKLVTSLDSVLLAYPIEGVNIDIEYTGEVTPNLRKRLNDFMKKLDQHLQRKYPKVKLSIDVYASAANGGLWDMAEIQSSVDYIVIMAYDFHRRSSPNAGPVAPVFGGDNLWGDDITKNLREFLKVVPREKILLGVPFYGYEWQTTSRDSQAHTYPDTGATASVTRVQELLAKKSSLKLEEQWNDVALSPYLTYQKGHLTYIVYYENSRSLSYKIDLVNQLNLGGIAIWALGYEGDSRELWDVVKKKI